MSCGRTPLPLELWGLIIGCLSRTDQRSCLSVSTSLRALARPVVFSCITIHFGIWMAPRFYSDLEMQLIKRQKIINSEILRYIACDPQLARAIKTFSVHAHNLDELAWQWSASDLVSVFGTSFGSFQQKLNAGRSSPPCDRKHHHRAGIYSTPSILPVVRLQSNDSVLDARCSGKDKLWIDAHRTDYLVCSLTSILNMKSLT